MTETLCLFIYLRTRYETPGKNGETRAERNRNFGQEHLTPDLEPPDIGFYLIQWFDEIRASFCDIVDGVPIAIPPTEIKAWSELTGRIVRPVEYAILSRMHSVWRAAMAEEIQASRATPDN